MIIACPNCATKYNFPDDRIGEDGVDVRCVRCKHEFHVDAPGHEQHVAEDIPPPFVTPAEEPAAEQDEQAGLRAEDFDVPEDEEEAGPPSESTPEGEDEEREDPAAAERDSWEFPKDKSETTFTGAGFSLEDFGGNETGEGDAPGARPSGKSRVIALTVAVAGFLAILTGGLYFLDMWPFGAVQKVPVTTPAVPPAPPAVEQPNGPEPEVKKPEKAVPDSTAKIVDSQQYYLQNERIGEMLVISGKVMNISSGPKEMYKLEATLFDVNKKPLASKQFLAGNEAALFQLRSMSKDELESTLNSRVGQLTNNTNVAPGSFVSYMVVFYNPPANISEYLVRVIDFQEPLRAKPAGQP